MKLFLLVFEDNQLELVDAGCIYTSPEVAEGVRVVRQGMWPDRTLVVRPMDADTRKSFAAV